MPESNLHGNSKQAVWFNKKFALSIQQEFWAWRYAYHGNGMKATREAYACSVNNKGVQNTIGYRSRTNVRLMKYVVWLRRMHKLGKIDLEAGPWSYYHIWDVGNPEDPGNSIRAEIRRYREEAAREGVISLADEEEQDADI